MTSVSKNYNEAWSNGRPVFNRLPVSAYQDNPMVDAITKPIDDKLAEVKATVEGLAEALNPVTCPDEYLDYVGWLNGFSGRYWDARWSYAVKRQLVVNSQYIWKKRGRAEVISYLLGIHGVNHDVWRTGSLTLPAAMPATFGSPRVVIYIRLPLSYSRSSWQWIEAERTRYNYLHSAVRHKVVYEMFKIGHGFSKLGDPMFSRGIV